MRCGSFRATRVLKFFYIKKGLLLLRFRTHVFQMGHSNRDDAVSAGCEYLNHKYSHSSLQQYLPTGKHIEQLHLVL
jgi:hypothetical protein